jgi:hypothetical protein
VTTVRRKFAAIVLALAVVLLATPMLGTAMAKSPNKLPAQAIITGLGGYDENIEYRTTGHGVEHLIYFKMWGTILLFLDDGPPIPVDWVDICDGIYNPVSNTGVYRFDEVWTLPDGTFVGTDKLSVEGNILGDYTGMHTHIVLKGSLGGVYEGQVINLKMDTDESDWFLGTWLKS